MSAEKTPFLKRSVTDQLTLRAVDERYDTDTAGGRINTGYSIRLAGPPRSTAKMKPVAMSRKRDAAPARLRENVLLFLRDEMVGVLSFNQIEPLNKTGYIGYWIDEHHQGQGLLSQALQAFMHYYARRGEVRRFVIKCRVANHKSNGGAAQWLYPRRLSETGRVSERRL